MSNPDPGTEMTTTTSTRTIKSLERGLTVAERFLASSALRLRVWRKARSPLTDSPRERIAERVAQGEKPMTTDDLRDLIRG